MEIIIQLANVLSILAKEIPEIIASAAVLAAFLPKPSETGGALSKIHWLINKLAFNFANAKNEIQ